LSDHDRAALILLDGREPRLTVIGTEGVALGRLALGSTHDPLAEDSVLNSFNRLTETEMS
jgi:hypothetical protein